MQQTTNDQAARSERLKALGFKGEERVGITPISLDINQERFLEVKSEIKTFDSKNHGEIEYIDVTDVESGEDGALWLGGGLKYNVKMLLEKNQAPFAISVKRMPKQSAMVTVDGKTVEKDVNQYKVTLLK